MSMWICIINIQKMATNIHINIQINDVSWRHWWHLNTMFDLLSRLWSGWWRMWSPLVVHKVFPPWMFISWLDLFDLYLYKANLVGNQITKDSVSLNVGTFMLNNKWNNVIPLEWPSMTYVVSMDTTTHIGNKLTHLVGLLMENVWDEDWEMPWLCV